MKLSPAAILALVVIFWGLNWPVIKIALADSPPLWFGVLRFAIGAAALFAVQAALGGIHRPSRKDGPVIVIAGVFQVGLLVACIHLGVDMVGAGRAALLVYTTPIWVIPLAAVFLGEKITLGKGLGGLIGLAGIGVLFNPLTLDYGAPGVLTGNLLLIGGALCLAVPIVVIRRHAWEGNSLALAPWQQSIGTALLLVLAVLFEGAPDIDPTPSLLAATAYNGLVASAFCMWGYFHVARHMPSSTAALGSLGVPVIGVAASAAALGEPLDGATLTGMALILSGIAVSVARRRPGA